MKSTNKDLRDKLKNLIKDCGIEDFGFDIRIEEEQEKEAAAIAYIDTQIQDIFGNDISFDICLGDNMFCFVYTPEDIYFSEWDEYDLKELNKVLSTEFLIDDGSIKMRIEINRIIFSKEYFKDFIKMILRIIVKTNYIALTALHRNKINCAHRDLIEEINEKQSEILNTIKGSADYFDLTYSEID